VELPNIFTPIRLFSHPEFLQGLRDLAFQDPNWLYTNGLPDEEPLQGDVFPEARLYFTGPDGEPVEYIGSAMLVANSCDAVPAQDPVAAMAPVVPLELFERERGAGDAETLRRNRFSSRMYLPAQGEKPELYVDFRYTAAVSTARIREMFKAAGGRGGIVRLSESGWYLLTGKIAYSFARGGRS
jgi:hypothetical protein